MSLYYCDELDKWSEDPEQEIHDLIADKGAENLAAEYEWQAGKKVNLADYVDAEVILEHFDNNWDIVSDDGDPPSNFVTDEQQKELETFLKTWAAKIDYNYYLQDHRGERMTVKVKDLIET